MALAQTNISGLISSNTTWTTSGNPYIITGNTVVNTGAQLTVEPGVVVKFDADKSLLINGTMQAVGTGADTIVFTSNLANPQPGDWGQIAFSDLSMDFDNTTNLGNLMEFCVVEYGGGSGTDGNILFENSSGKLNQIAVRHGLSKAVRIQGQGTTDFYILNSELSNCESGVFIGQPSNHSGGQNVRIIDCLIKNNISYGIEINITQGVSNGVWFYLYINDNQILNNAGGIGTTGSYYGYHETTIANNSIADNSVFGVSMSAASIVNNFIASNHIGVIMTGGVVRNNTIVESDSVGVKSYACVIERNLLSGNQDGIMVGSSFFLGDTVRNNIVVNSNGHFALRSKGAYNSINSKNQFIDNVCSKEVVLLENSESQDWLKHHTIVRNYCASTINPSTVRISPETQSQVPQFTGNNIFDNGSVDGIDVTCNEHLNINATNCYWGTIDELEIQAVIHDFLDDPSLAFVNYAPFLTTPDTTAPITPVKNLSKVDLGNGQVKLCWDSNLEVDLTGYKVYYGSPTGYSFSNFVDVGNVNTYTISGLSINDSIAVTAYDIFADEFEDQLDGNESWFTYAENATLNPNFSTSSNNLIVDFENLSNNAETVFWDFGDGTTSSNVNPQHTFAETNTYNVCLTVGNGCAGSETVCQLVSVSCPTPQSEFTFTTSGLEVTFTDQSSGSDDWSWDFGDGFQSSIQNPTHTFSGADTYEVCLMVENDCGTHTTCQQVSVSCLAPQSSFTYSANGLEVSFTDQSSGSNDWSWDFGDGFQSNIQNPSHTFSGADTYEVCLIAENDCGTNTFCEFVTVECSGSFNLIATGDLEFCDGDSVLLEAQSGLSDYDWNTGATTQTIYATEEGDYYTSGMSGGCEFLSDTVNVSVITIELIIEENGNDLTCPGSYVSYQWFLNDTIISGATSQTITAPISGNYTVEVVDDNGCVGTSYTLEFTLQTGITENGTSVPFSVYPNPSNGMFRLDMQEAKPYSVEVFNALGQLVLTESYKPNDVASIELTSVGIYHLRVFIEDAVYVLKVVKK